MHSIYTIEVEAPKTIERDTTNREASTKFLHIIGKSILQK